MSETQGTVPNPGSAEAAEQGCKCPVIDNHYGRGVPMGKDGAPLFWRSEKCPLHGADTRQWLTEQDIAE